MAFFWDLSPEVFRLVVGEALGLTAAGFAAGVGPALGVCPFPRVCCCFVGFDFGGVLVFVGVVGVDGGVGVCFFFVPFGGIVRTVLRVAATLCVRSSHSPSRYSHGLHALVLGCIPAV